MLDTHPIPHPPSDAPTRSPAERPASERTPRDVVLRTVDLTKSYQDPAHPALAAFSLDVHRGDVVALLGPSGCGKTTLLRLIAGFELPDRGTVEIAGREVTGPRVLVPPERRNLGFVFQDYALFPHLDVLHNVAFGLADRPRRERLERARATLDLVGLTIFSGRYPNQLSGGQQQRVALARALAPAPEVVLLDEPFSNLDAALRGSTRDDVRRILERTGTTAILVTHDQEEAMSFADRLAVMRAGRLEQVGQPEAAYLRPRTPFVANFLGSTNLLRGVAHGEVADTPLGLLPLCSHATGPVLLSLRPENLLFGDDAGVRVVIVSRAFKGHDLTFTCRLDPEDLDPEDHAASGAVFTVQTGPTCHLRPGDSALLTSRGEAVPLEGSSRG